MLKKQELPLEKPIAVIIYRTGDETEYSSLISVEFIC